MKETVPNFLQFGLWELEQILYCNIVNSTAVTNAEILSDFELTKHIPIYKHAISV